MTPYFVYDESGRIMRTGVCQEHMVHKQARVGETAMAGRADQKRDAVVDGIVMDKADANFLLEQRAAAANQSLAPDDI